MQKHLVVLVSLSLAAVGGCSKTPSPEAYSPEPFETTPTTFPPQANRDMSPDDPAAPPGSPGEGIGFAGGQQPEQPEQDPGAPLRVAPALSVVAVDVECGDGAVFFETDSATLGPIEKQRLEQFASCLRATKESERIQLTGRADPRASEPYNRELSEQRATAVRQFLREQGVDETRLEIRAMGERGAIEGMPLLWPIQRRVGVEVQEP